MRSTCGKREPELRALRPAPAPPGWNPAATTRSEQRTAAGVRRGKEGLRIKSPAHAGMEAETPAQGLDFLSVGPTDSVLLKSLCQLAHLESRSLGRALTPGIWVSVSRAQNI